MANKEPSFNYWLQYIYIYIYVCSLLSNDWLESSFQLFIGELLINC